MSKENEKRIFKNPFAKKDEAVDMRTDETDDYTIKRNQRTDVIIRILSIIGAILIWIYAVSTDVATYEFKNKEVELRGVQAVETQGYTVQYDALYVTFKLQGSAGKISQIEENSAGIYADMSSVDLSDIVGSKTVKIPLVFEFPKDLTCMEKSQDYIEVVISSASSDIAG